MRQPEHLPEDCQITKIKGPLLQFAKADDDERSDMLFDSLKQAVQSQLHPGVGRLEVLLEAVGLGGGVDDGVRRTILELSEVRNVAVHRNSRADRRLIKRCPWLGLKEGDPVRPDGVGFEMYVAACFWYMLDLDSRLRSPADEGDEKEAKYLADIEETKELLVTRLAYGRKAREVSAVASPA